MILPLMLFLGACSVSKAQWEPQVEKTQYQVDTSPRHVINVLKEQGHTDVIVTGLRTELCEDRDAVIGYGVILKQIDKTGKPTAIGATVCLDWNDTVTVTRD